MGIGNQLREVWGLFGLDPPICEAFDYFVWSCIFVYDIVFAVQNMKLKNVISPVKERNSYDIQKQAWILKKYEHLLTAFIIFAKNISLKTKNFTKC